MPDPAQKRSLQELECHPLQEILELVPEGLCMSNLEHYIVAQIPETSIVGKI